MNPKTLCDQNTKEQLAEKVMELRDAIEEAIPECWDTPKAERILREAIDAAK